MKIIYIPKKHGRRKIYVPNDDEKHRLRKLNDTLTKYPIHKSAHAFIKGKGIITNALEHSTKQNTLTLDLANFFDNCTKQKAQGLGLSKEILEYCFIDGATRQGLPTSPALANIIFRPTDIALCKTLDKIFTPLNRVNARAYIYTRYADDLSISYNNPYNLPRLNSKFNRALIQQTIATITRSGWKINPRKIRLDKNHRREICGVLVDSKQGTLAPTRRLRRKLRAFRHKHPRSKQTRGLAEFIRLNPPHIDPDNLTDTAARKLLTIQEYNALCQHNDELTPIRNPMLYRKSLPERREKIDANHDFILTGDPVYIAGMSTLTTGWSSCMGLVRGAARATTSYHVHLEGSHIAGIVNTRKKITYNGITREPLTIRAIVYACRDGKKAFGYIYPRSDDVTRNKYARILTIKLLKLGFYPLDHIEHTNIGNDPEIRALIANLRKPTNALRDYTKQPLTPDEIRTQDSRYMFTYHDVIGNVKALGYGFYMETGRVIRCHTKDKTAVFKIRLTF